jgi:hypothetical protein
MFNLIHHKSQFKADIYLAARDPLHAWALGHRRRIELGDGGAWIAPPECVIVRKLEFLRAGGSDKHLRDIRFIVAATPLDRGFIEAEVTTSCGASGPKRNPEADGIRTFGKRLRGKEVPRMRIGNGIVAVFVAFLLLAGASFPAAARYVTPAALDKIKPGVTTAKEAEQILGRPAGRSNFPRLGLTSMDYEMMEWTEWYFVSVMIGKDGVVRDVQKLMLHRGRG